MDTIIYLGYMKSETADAPGACSYLFREHVLQDYRLIKVLVREAISVLETPPKPAGRKIGFSLNSIGRRMRYRRNRERQIKMRNQMKDCLCRELAGILQERDDIRLYYDESVGVNSWVRRILPFREFEEFLEITWVHRLLGEIPNPHFMVLGDRPYIRELLWELAPRMKSLVWVLQDRGAEDFLEDFGEEFYQETGLSIRLEFLPEGTTYGQYTVPEYFVKNAVNILDFTEGKYIPRFNPPKGSLWFDFASDLHKERRIRVRGLNCQVISFRKQWKNAPFA